MLKTLVGEEGYRKTTDLYFARHDGQGVLELKIVGRIVEAVEPRTRHGVAGSRLFQQAGGVAFKGVERGSRDGGHEKLLCEKALSPSRKATKKRIVEKRLGVRDDTVFREGGPSRRPGKAHTQFAPERQSCSVKRDGRASWRPVAKMDVLRKSP